jgi:hypothetical protein
MAKSVADGQEKRGATGAPFYFLVRFVVPRVSPNMIESYAPVRLQQ